MRKWYPSNRMCNPHVFDATCTCMCVYTACGCNEVTSYKMNYMWNILYTTSKLFKINFFFLPNELAILWVFFPMMCRKHSDKQSQLCYLFSHKEHGKQKTRPRRLTPTFRFWVNHSWAESSSGLSISEGEKRMYQMACWGQLWAERGVTWWQTYG